jgi:hypothetical protein
MGQAKRVYFQLPIALVLLAFLSGAESAAQTNGVPVDGVVRSGAGDGVSGAQVRLIGPIIEDPTTYTPSPALTSEMRARIERFLLESRQMNAPPELMVNAAQRMEAEFLGLPIPGPPASMMIPPEVTTVSDGDGRFTFRNVRPGRYTVRAAHEGYWGAVRPGAPAAPPDTFKGIDVTAEPDAAAVSLMLIKGGAVSGRALDSEGRALSGFNVTIFRPAYQDTGRAVLASAGSKTTDELGQYRLVLPVGEYYAAVVPRQPGNAPGPQDRYTRTFYPNMVDARMASRLTLGEGVELSAIDINVSGEPTRKLSGRVVIPAAGPSTGAPPNLTLFLVNRDANALNDNSAPTFPNLAADRSGGRFEIRGVRPGAYDLIVSVLGAATGPRGGEPGPARLLGWARIDVGERDLDDVTITIQTGVEVTARLLIDGKPPTPLPAWAMHGPGAGDEPVPTAPSVRLVMQSKENYPAPYRDTGRNSTYDPSVGFVFRGMPDGRFVFRVESQGGEALPASAFIADVREAGTSILDGDLTINGKPPGAIEVLVSTRGERVTGSVRDAEQKPVAAARVVLAPLESRRQNLSLFKTILSDTTGNFKLEGIAPGDYKLFAWKNAPLNAYLNAEFLANYELRGQPVTIKAGAPVKIDLPVIGP